MDCCDIPAPGRLNGFSPDEVLIYGIPLKQRGVIAVAVTNGGSGYGSDTDVTFTSSGGGGAEALAFIDEATGAIHEIIVTHPGSYKDAAPTVTFTHTGGGTGASAVAVLGTTAILNVEESRWNIGIQALLDPNGGRKVASERANGFAMVAAYGYGYEGHCYRFDRPRLLGFAMSKNSEVKGPIGCGFDLPPSAATGGTWYKAWRVRSSQRIIEMGMSVGLVEEVILDANRPGRRPPNTYASEMQLAHRGGRLTSG